MGLNIKKKHHYLPEFYLKVFCNAGGKIWTYKKESPLNPFSNTPSETAIINKLYNLENDLDINMIENFLSDNIEAPAAFPFKKLLKKSFPDPTEKMILSIFLGTLIARTPFYIEHLNIQNAKILNNFAKLLAHDKQEFFKNHKKIHPTTSNNEIEQDRQAIINGEISFELEKDILLSYMINIGIQSAQFINKMNWALIETDENNYFITSDHPVAMSNASLPKGFFQPSLAMNNTELFIPISNTLSLNLMNNTMFKEGKVYNINQKVTAISGDIINLKLFIEYCNKRTFCNSNKYIFSSSNSIKFLEK